MELDSPYVGKSTQIQEETWFSTVEDDMSSTVDGRPGKTGPKRVNPSPSRNRSGPAGRSANA
jgi:hypothetical protein